MYDQSCAELAGEFIRDCLDDTGAEAPPDHVASLAQAIQDAIEEWLEERDYFKRDTRDTTPAGPP